MTLLFITQKLHGQDAFGVTWANAFVARGYDVHLICLEYRPADMAAVLPAGVIPCFTVHSLGKEERKGKVAQILRFLTLILTLHYDRVFIHMTPVWGLFGAPVWIVRRIPTYLWYTHYQMQTGLWMLGHYAKRMFCATPQSLPQYQSRSPEHPEAKKVVVGHGIDLSLWPPRANGADDPHRLLCVHRLSRSKRLELSLEALTLLPAAYTLDIYGIEAEKDYVSEMRALVEKLQLQQRVRFHGTVPLKDLPALYCSHRLILNMASETIDKTMLEALTCGCYPMTTKRNAVAIGIPEAPEEDTPQAIADFIQKHSARAPLSADDMYRVVAERHSLAALVEKMDAFIRPGQ